MGCTDRMSNLFIFCDYTEGRKERMNGKNHEMVASFRVIFSCLGFVSDQDDLMKRSWSCASTLKRR